MSEAGTERPWGDGGPAGVKPAPPSNAPRSRRPSTSVIVIAAIAAAVVLIIVPLLVALAAFTLTRDDQVDLEEVASEAFSSDEFVVVEGDEESAEVVLGPTALAVGGTSDLEDLLDKLGFSSAVLGRMEQTRALDSTQEAEGDGVNVTWTYHPDDGLRLVFEREG